MNLIVLTLNFGWVEICLTSRFDLSSFQLNLLPFSQNSISQNFRLLEATFQSLQSKKIKHVQSNLPYRSPQINGHLCLTVTLRPAQLILLYNLTLFNGHLSNAANGHLFHAWIVRSSSNNGHFGHLITWHNVYDRSRDTVTFKIINNRRREIQLIELVI